MLVEEDIDVKPANPPRGWSHTHLINKRHCGEDFACALGSTRNIHFEKRPVLVMVFSSKSSKKSNKDVWFLWEMSTGSAGNVLINRRIRLALNGVSQIPPKAACTSADI